MNLNVSLTDELVHFVKSKVETGRYASSSEVVREALRLLEKHDRDEADQRDRLRHAWQDGIDSGDFQEVDFDRLRQDARRRFEVSKG